MPGFLNMYADGKHRKTTHEDLQQIARVNPTVYAALGLYRAGALTWDEALMECIYVLVAQNDALVKELIRVRSEMPMLGVQIPYLYKET